jgi:hypothetical protein
MHGGSPMPDFKQCQVCRQVRPTISDKEEKESRVVVVVRRRSPLVVVEIDGGSRGDQYRAYVASGGRYLVVERSDVFSSTSHRDFNCASRTNTIVSSCAPMLSPFGLSTHKCSKSWPICQLIPWLIVNRWVSDTITAYRSDLSRRPIYQSNSRYFSQNILNFATYRDLVANSSVRGMIFGPLVLYSRRSHLINAFCCCPSDLVVSTKTKWMEWKCTIAQFFPFFNLNARVKVTLLSNTPMLFFHSIFLKVRCQNLGFMEKTCR